jgi:hypothetical protein
MAASSAACKLLWWVLALLPCVLATARDAERCTHIRIDGAACCSGVFAVTARQISGQPSYALQHDRTAESKGKTLFFEDNYNRWVVGSDDAQPGKLLMVSATAVVNPWQSSHRWSSFQVPRACIICRCCRMQSYQSTLLPQSVPHGGPRSFVASPQITATCLQVMQAATPAPTPG